MRLITMQEYDILLWKCLGRKGKRKIIKYIYARIMRQE